MSEPATATDGPKVCNVEAEFLLLGALMQNNRLIEDVADVVSPEDFYEAAFGRIYSVILREHSLGRSVNPVTIKTYFEDDAGVKELGGAALLVRMTAETGAMLSAIPSARQIRDMARRRKLIAGLQEATAMAQDMAKSNEEVCTVADAAISDLNDASEGIIRMTAFQAYREMLKAYDEPKTGVTCGVIASLDEALGPICRHHFTLLAARPAMGKTSTALSYSLGAARLGHGVLFVSIEMNRIDLMQRVAADMQFKDGFGVPYEAIRDNNFRDQRDRDRVYAALREFRELPLNIIDAASCTPARLNMLVQRERRKFEAKGQKLELVVIDYIQRMRADGRTNTETEAISSISMGVKDMAKRQDVGVLALAQLNRGVESRDDRRPNLSDLRGSGQLEQDADAVCFLYRDEYYLRKEMNKLTADTPEYAEAQIRLADVNGKIEFIIAKRRNGPETTAYGQFWGKFQAVRG